MTTNHTTTNDTTANGTTSPLAQRSYDEVLADAVRVLIDAARDQADFAEFVTHALAGAAANLGGIEHVLAGRPGSWEADKVRDLLCSTVGYDEQYLVEHRTEPLIVRVHVHDILSDLGIEALYDEAHDELDAREQAICGRVEQKHGEVKFVDDVPAADRAGLDALDQMHEALNTQRRREWAAYGEAFHANVLQAAAELFPTLPVPVEVIVELDRRGDLGPGDPWDGPEWRLWETARRNTPLPGSGIPPKDYPTGGRIEDIERQYGRLPLARLNEGEEGRP